MMAHTMWLVILACLAAFESACAYNTSPLPLRSRRAHSKMQRPMRHSLIRLSGSQMESDWNTLKILEVSDAAEGLKNVIVEVGPSEEGSLSAAYTVPGMFTQLKPAQDPDAKPSFFAIASAPLGSDKFEFLVKETEGSQWLCGKKAGDVVDVSPVMGNGFAIEDSFNSYKYDFPCQLVNLVAAGSGIAPMRAAIEARSGINLNWGRQCKLYYGVQTPAQMAYAEKFQMWAKLGVEVIPVVSRPSNTGWPGRTGYVQQAIAEDGVRVPRNCGVLMCGMKGMTEDVRGLFEAAGTFEGRILTNF